ncbi:hypothetical protein FEM48_Zijuj05G0061800 [Ziziphus jujuba var. spinosa]|uniref:Cytochrome P450 71A1-like n=1 Tax=Ziziphus jujuba var. spinosa TaxID=714518 RepID=A0A978VD96_ZIZJJ|nr:hypothetical protein FEM48_Zijuj05G0061800 [Ziziphus jujuba var. spinosa]
MVHRIADSYPGTTNLSKFLETYANNIICRVAFGRDFSEGEYDQHGLQKTLVEFQELLGGLSLGDFFPSMEEIIHSFTGMKSRLQKTFRRFDLLLDQIVNEHLNPMREKEEHKDLVNVLLDIQKNRSLEMPLTMDNAKAIILEHHRTHQFPMFLEVYANDVLCRVAFGRDFSEGGEYEKHGFQKMLEEYQELLGGFSLGDFFPSMEFIHSLTGMKSRLQETFRRFDHLFDQIVNEHVNPMKEKEEHKDLVDVLLDIKKNGSLEMPLTMDNIKAIILIEKTLAKDEYNFKIDNFQDFELIPFGAGRRSCPAITFGTASVELALAQLLHSFDWELPEGVTAKDLDMTEVFGITMHRIADLIVLAKPHFS